MLKKPTKKEALVTLRSTEKKWTKPLIAAGWLAFPSVILERQHALGLTPLDVNIILYLVTYWWTPDNRPHPSKRTIATAIGVSARTVQRRIAALEKVRFIWREERRIPKKGSKTNGYHLDGLIEAATPFALEKIDLIKKRKKENEERQRRKRPVLRVVSDLSERDEK